MARDVLLITKSSPSSVRDSRVRMLDEIVGRSGHFTYRVWFKDQPNQVDKRAVERSLAGHGATMEWSSPNLLAVDVANDAIAEAVVDELARRGELGQLEWEAGQ